MFFFQFDRSHRGKSDSLSGLEEVLNCLQPSDFEDEQLSRFKGLCWQDYVAFKDPHPEERDSFPIDLKYRYLGSENKEKTLNSDIKNSGDIKKNNNKNNSSSYDTNNSLSQPPVVAVNDTALLLQNEQKEVASSDSSTHLAALCVEQIKAPSKRRHPLALMRTFSERTLSLDKAKPLFSFSSDKSSSNTDKSVLNNKHCASLSPSPTNKSPNKNINLNSSSECAGLESVREILEAANNSMKSAQNKNDNKRREAVWDLFQSECAFLYDHLMVLKNVSKFPIMLLPDTQI